MPSTGSPCIASRNGASCVHRLALDSVPVDLSMIVTLRRGAPSSCTFSRMYSSSLVLSLALRQLELKRASAEFVSILWGAYDGHLPLRPLPMCFFSNSLIILSAFSTSFGALSRTAPCVSTSFRAKSASKSIRRWQRKMVGSSSWKLGHGPDM